MLAKVQDPEAYNRDVVFPHKVQINLEYMRNYSLIGDIKYILRTVIWLTQMLGTEFSPWPCYTEEEILAVSSVLASNRVNYWTGTQCRDFEAEFCTWTGAAHSIAVANGTVALEMALRAMEIGVGDEVIVTPRTFIASASAIVNVGGKPVFADVDAESQNITAATIAKVVTPRTRAIMCVHLAGWPCEMDHIVEIASEFDLRMVEDCAQAHGARYRGKSVGTIGDIGAWSFCQDKIMTTCGDGGMLTTNDQRLVVAYVVVQGAWKIVFCCAQPGAWARVFAGCIRHLARTSE